MNKPTRRIKSVKAKRTKINKSDVGDWTATKYFKFNQPVTALQVYDDKLYACVDDSVYIIADNKKPKKKGLK